MYMKLTACLLGSILLLSSCKSEEEKVREEIDRQLKIHKSYLDAAGTNKQMLEKALKDGNNKLAAQIYESSNQYKLQADSVMQILDSLSKALDTLKR